MHRCTCHERVFKTIRGLTQHLNYISRTTKQQEQQCTAVIEDLNNSTIAPDSDSEPVYDSPDETHNEKHAVHDKIPVSLENNEWTSTEYLDTQSEVNSMPFNDYVIQHLKSLTDFTRNLYLKVEHVTQEKNISPEQDTLLIKDLLVEVEYLRKHCEDQNKTIAQLTKIPQVEVNQSNKSNYTWQPVTRSDSYQASQKRKPCRDNNSGINTENQYAPLSYAGNDCECTDACRITDSNVLAEYEYTQARKSKYPSHKIYTSNNPENNKILSWRSKKSVVPGVNTYSDITKNEKKVAIFGDSLCKRVLGSKLNPKLKKCSTFVRPFVGATADELQYHIQPTIKQSDLNGVVLLIGTNNLAPRRNQPVKSTLAISHDIINVGVNCRDAGIEDIFISSLPIRRHYEEKVREVNIFVKDLCEKEGFIFISNEDITCQHLYDGTHLTNEGIDILSNNFVNAINELYHP